MVQLFKDFCLRMAGPYFVVFLFCILSFEISESFILIFLKEPFDKLYAPICPVVAAFCLLEEEKAVLSFKGFRMIGLRGGEDITAVFDNAGIRPVHHNDSPPIEVTPVFPVMLIPLRVMERDKGKTIVLFPFLPDRRGSPLVIVARRNEFRKRELGEIMEKTAEENPAVQSVANDLMAVLFYRNKMLERMGFHHFSLSFSVFLFSLILKGRKEIFFASRHLSR